MSEPSYFDAHCFLGLPINTPGDRPRDAAALLAEMDHFGITQALVLDPGGAYNDVRNGNARIVQLTRDHPRLHPAWCALMTRSRETPPPDELVAGMLEHGVGALFLFTGQFGIPLEDWAVGDLAAELERHRAPLFLCPNPALDMSPDQTDWAAMVGLCRAHPDLPVVVSECRIYGGQRRMYQALDACPNLKVDLGGLWLHKRIEFICREFGAHRLLWSSRLPSQTPAASKAQLDYSDISPEELQAIAGGNLRQLLSWSPRVTFAPAQEWPEPVDELHEMARGRTPLTGQGFMDCHGHVGWGSRRHVIQDSPQDVVAEMTRLGVEVCCLFPFAGSQPDETLGNDTCAEMVRAFPGRFVGFTLVNPSHGEQAMLTELERGLERGMHGIKLAPGFQGYPDEGPLVDVACRFANEHGLLMLHHNWGSAQQVRRLCETYPDAVVFTGHSAGHLAQVVRDCPNLFICTCPFLDWQQTERYVELYGADRLLFGSDLMDLPIAWGLGPILYARIPLEDKRLILGGNLRRILNARGFMPARG